MEKAESLNLAVNALIRDWAERELSCSTLGSGWRTGESLDRRRENRAWNLVDLA